MLMEVALGILFLIPTLFFVARILFKHKREPIWLAEEDVFLDPSTDTVHKFPSLLENEKGTKTLSVIVPAYNEEERLPIMLDETIEYLETRQKKEKTFTYEIIIVDDGSKDKTTKIGIKYASKYTSDVVRVLTLKKNRGKGGAVKRGMLCGRGNYLLMVDADGATKFSDLERLQSKLDNTIKGEHGIAFGSRSHLQEEAVAKRTLLRNILMYGFHFLVSILCVRGIQDTQCGFKLFTRKSARVVFPVLHIERWAFDVECAMVAHEYFKIPIVEVPVNWHEVAGSKLSPFAASVQMGKDILTIRLAYLLGIWSVKS